MDISTVCEFIYFYCKFSDILNTLCQSSFNQVKVFITIQCKWLRRSISEFESLCDLYFSPSVSSPVGVFVGRGGSVEPLNHCCGVRVYDRRQRRGWERHFDLCLLYRLMKGTQKC